METNNVEEAGMQTIIISLNDSTNGKEALQHVKDLLEHLSKVSLEEVDGKLLKHVMPSVKRNLQKVFKDNILLMGSIDDEIVSVLVMENMQLCLGFIVEIRRIVCCLLENEEVELYCICSHLVNIPQCVHLIFEHYQNSQDLYKGKFDSELSDILNISEELHLLFLRLLESHVTISKNNTDFKPDEVLIAVMDSICNIADVISQTHPKLTIETWKSFTTIIQKFRVEIEESFNIKLPIQCLTSVINKNLMPVDDMVKTDANSIIQLIRCSSYLLRILLNLCTIFWKCLVSVCSDVLNFLCTIYRVPVICMRYPNEILCLIDNQIFKHMDIFVAKLIQDKELFQVMFQEMQVGNQLHACPLGGVNLVTTILKMLPQTNENSEDSISILKFTFSLIDLCEGAFWTGSFYTLVIYIAAVIKECDMYEAIEMILLGNIMQKNPYRAALAIEIWTLYLEKSNVEFCNSVVHMWLQHLKKLNFRTFTTTPEKIYLEIFSQKLFNLLPNEKKSDVATKYSPDNSIGIWKWVKFKEYPFEQKSLLNNLISSTLSRVTAMENLTNFNDLIFLGERLDLLSTVNPLLCNELNYFNLLSAVCSIWSINLQEDIVKNNIFKYFFICSGKFIRTFGVNLGPSHLHVILPKLKLLSRTDDDAYQLLVCDLLQVFLPATLNEPQKTEILQIAEDLSTSVLQSNSHIATHQLFRVIKHFSGTPQGTLLLNTVTKSLNKPDQDVLYRFLHGQNNEELIFKLFQEIKLFKHKCIEWSYGDMQPLLKKFKLDDSVDNYLISHNDQKQTSMANNQKKASIENINQIRLKQKNKHAKNTKENTEIVEEDACAQEVIDRLKGEVKCLFKIIKTEKLTTKNGSDLNMIANQLLSIL